MHLLQDSHQRLILENIYRITQRKGRDFRADMDIWIALVYIYIAFDEYGLIHHQRIFSHICSSTFNITTRKTYFPVITFVAFSQWYDS